MRAILTLSFMLVSTAALAHAGHGTTDGLLSGFMHPVGGLDHVLAMVVVGFFAYVLGGRALYLVPLSFVGMMAAGFVLGVGGLQLPFVELGIALSSVVIGAVAAMGRPMPAVAAMALAGAFAVFHGLAHGTEMPTGAAGFEYAVGFLLATALLHGAGIAAASAVARLVGRHGRALAQAAGGFLALGGVGVLVGWL